MNIKLPLGVLVSTPGAIAAMSGEHMSACLRRHASGDWGVLDADDREANDKALASGGRLMSTYLIDESAPEKGKFWIITEADRSATTCLLPEEY